MPAAENQPTTIASERGYNIHLPVFDGPFDLLLFFIERDEVDVYDIPIATLTNDFLEYLRAMQERNIDLASEFILMAATLMRIKSRMLLPRREKDEAGNDIDPREELVERLLAYKRYKSVLDELRTLEDNTLLREPRSTNSVATELADIATKALVDIELEDLTLFKLLKTYQAVLKRYDDAAKLPPVHAIIRYNYTIDEQKTWLQTVVAKSGKAGFAEVFGTCRDRIHALFNFLALLELIQSGVFSVFIGDAVNDFWVEMPLKAKEEA